METQVTLTIHTKEGHSQRKLKTAMSGPVTFSNFKTAKSSVCVCQDKTDIPVLMLFRIKIVTLREKRCKVK